MGITEETAKRLNELMKRTIEFHRSIKYRPFKSQEECWNEMLKHQPLGWLRSKRIKDICQLITIRNHEIRIFADLPLYFSRAYREYEFLDGSPFGIKEE